MRRFTPINVFVKNNLSLLSTLKSQNSVVLWGCLNLDRTEWTHSHQEAQLFIMLHTLAFKCTVIHVVSFCGLSL